MKNKITVLVLLSFTSIVAQKNMSDFAASCYEDLNFYKSSEVYNHIYDKNVRQGKVDYNVTRMAANSNIKIRNYTKALTYLKVLIDANQANDADQLNYVKLALMQGQDEEAKRIASQITAKNPSNKLCAEMIANPNFVRQLKTDSLMCAVKPLACNSIYDEFTPTIYNGGIVFASNRRSRGVDQQNYLWDNQAFLDLFYTSTSDEYSDEKIKCFKEIKSIQHDGSVVFTKDNSRAFAIQNDFVTKGLPTYNPALGIYEYTKTGSKWSEPKPFKYNTKESNISYVHLSEDGKTLYFASNRAGGFGGFDIYSSTNVNGDWSEPVNLGKEINTDGNEISPFLFGDQFYFSTDGRYGVGGLDVYSSKLVNNQFSVAENMGYPLNSSFDDFSLVVYDNGKKGYIGSNRNGTDDNLYYVTINKMSYKIDGSVFTDVTKKEKIPNTNVVIVDKNTGDTIRTQSDATGNFELDLPANHEYTISASKPGYVPTEPTNLSTKSIASGQRVIPADVFMAKDMVDLELDIRNSADGKPIDPVKGSVKSLSSGETKPINKGANGKFTVKLLPGDDYELNINQKGYLDYSRKFSLGDSLSGSVEIEPIQLKKITKGLVFQVDNVLYNYNDFTLLEDSKLALDKLIAFLKNNDNIRVEFSSHSDSRGAAAPNQTLSSKRSNSCVQYLITNGISANRIVSVGYGESKPINGCVDGYPCSEEQYQKNRRTEVKILEVK